MLYKLFRRSQNRKWKSWTKRPACDDSHPFSWNSIFRPNRYVFLARCLLCKQKRRLWKGRRRKSKVSFFCVREDPQIIWQHMTTKNTEDIHSSLIIELLHTRPWWFCAFFFYGMLSQGKTPEEGRVSKQHVCSSVTSSFMMSLSTGTGQSESEEVQGPILVLGWQGGSLFWKDRTKMMCSCSSWCCCSVLLFGSCSGFAFRLSFGSNIKFICAKSFRMVGAPTENLPEAAVEVGLGMELFEYNRTVYSTLAVLCSKARWLTECSSGRWVWSTCNHHLGPY